MANLVKKVNYDCPQCDQYHEVEVYIQETQSVMEGNIVTHEETFYLCPIENEEFTPAKVMNQNLLSARDAYRESIGRLPSMKIREIREAYKVTQKEFANLLGWGDVTVQRYESKTIQDETYDQMMKLVYDDPQLALKELEKHADRFEHERYLEIRDSITDLIKKNSLNYYKKQIIYASYIDFSEPSDQNGRTVMNLDKVRNVIHYLSHFSSKLYKVKLHKLLWNTDALAYKMYGHSMTGLVYKYHPLGAVPVAHEELLDICNDLISISEEYIDDYTAYRIESIIPVDISYFSSEEIDILDEVIRKFDQVGRKKKSDHTLEEEGYSITKQNEIIPFSLADKIRAF
ncbi:type II TA system antitoxin MqsA family protein [Sutcliffiella horikoshii]|uniref:type II TA system antitoxin MqsA family protein n=1 Tax=Sutcliffiella horikoshii TaxID=79883 RepID=UPI003CF1DC2D